MRIGQRGDAHQCVVWTDVVVTLALVLSENLRFLENVKRLALQKLVPRPAIETLTTTILPRAARPNV